MTGEPTFGLGAMKHAASFAKEHPIQQALRSTEIPLLPEPLNIPGSGASLASRAYAFGKGVFSPEGREAGINMLPHGKEINKFLKIGSRNVPSAEGQILGGPAAPRPRVTSQAFEDYPVDTRGIMNPAMRTDRAPSVAPPSWFETGPQPPTMQAQANDFVKSQIRPVTQMPSITSAASTEHPPFGKTSPFSPSQATRQQTPAIGGIQPTGVRGNPKALEIAKRLQEEMNKK